MGLGPFHNSAFCILEFETSVSAFQIPIVVIGLKQLKIKTTMSAKSISEHLTDAKRPGGVLRGGRLEIGVTGKDAVSSEIDFTFQRLP